MRTRRGSTWLTLGASVTREYHWRRARKAASSQDRAFGTPGLLGTVASTLLHAQASYPEKVRLRPGVHVRSASTDHVHGPSLHLWVVWTGLPQSRNRCQGQWDRENPDKSLMELDSLGHVLGPKDPTPRKGFAFSTSQCVCSRWPRSLTRLPTCPVLSYDSQRVIDVPEKCLVEPEA